MEYEELKSLWVQYDNKLDKLEKMNKKILFESLSHKPRRKITFLKYKCIHSIIVYPIVLIIVFCFNLNVGKVATGFIVGCSLSFAVLVYLLYANLKTFSALNAFNLKEDTVLESARKSNDVQNVYRKRSRNSLYTLPALFIGIVLIYWSNNHFNTSTIVLLTGLLVVLFLYNLKGSAIHKNMLEKLGREITELNEYVK